MTGGIKFSRKSVLVVSKAIRHRSKRGAGAMAGPNPSFRSSSLQVNKLPKLMRGTHGAADDLVKYRCLLSKRRAVGVSPSGETHQQPQ